jgi:hypothetical protein
MTGQFADETGTDLTPSFSAGARPWLTVALIFASSFVINEISESVETSGWIMVGAAMLVLLVMVRVESGTDNLLPCQGRREPYSTSAG